MNSRARTILPFFAWLPVALATLSAQSNCTQWTTYNNGVNGNVHALVSLSNGSLVVGGSFTSASGVSAINIARWTGSAWATVGPIGANNIVRALAVMPNGDLVAGGDFTAMGGAPASRIARWNGSAWTTLGSGMAGGATTAVYALAVLPNGDLVAGGDFATAGGVAANGIARWNGSAWAPLGTGVVGQVRALAVQSNGHIVAGGSMQSAGGVAVSNIARWDGAAWAALGGGLYGFNWVGPVVHSLAVLPSGDLVAGGTFTMAGQASAGNIAQWNGSAWSSLGGLGLPIGPSAVHGLAVMPNGDLVAGGMFSVGVSTSSIARWNGVAWSPLGAGTSGTVLAIARPINNQLPVGGGIHASGVTTGVARFVTACPANVSVVGAACASSGGANTFSALSQPWTGSVYRARGTGLPTFAFVAVVSGFTATAIPLGSILPPSPSGCVLLASPDVVDVVVSAAGTVDVQLAVPNAPALVGTQLHQQLVALEVDSNLNFVQNTSSNALLASIGTF